MRTTIKGSYAFLFFYILIVCVLWVLQLISCPSRNHLESSTASLITPLLHIQDLIKGTCPLVLMSLSCSIEKACDRQVADMFVFAPSSSMFRLVVRFSVEKRNLKIFHTIWCAENIRVEIDADRTHRSNSTNGATTARFIRRYKWQQFLQSMVQHIEVAHCLMIMIPTIMIDEIHPVSSLRLPGYILFEFYANRPTVSKPGGAPVVPLIGNTGLQHRKIE